MAQSAARLQLVDPAASHGIEVGDPTPDDDATTVSIGEDGTVSVEIGGAPEPEKPVNTRFDANLAERLDPGTLSRLASILIEGIESDIASRKEWEDTANAAPRYLGIKIEEPSAATADGTICKTVATCLLEAVIKCWSVARSELLPVGGPVKVTRDDMPMPAGHNGGPPLNEDDLANALESDLNWYLTVGDREYYPDTSKMLWHRALIGNAFKKVFRCPIKRKPLSRWVKAQNLVVSNDCNHLGAASRVTEIIKTRQGTMRRMQAQGYYLDTPLVAPTGDPTDTEEATAEIEGIAASVERPEDAEHTVWECTTELDSYTLPGLELLDKDEAGRKPDYPLPYRISLDYDSRAVIEVRRAWKQGDEGHERRKRYVKFGFVPGLGYYDLGLIHLAGNPTLAATMLLRSTVDGTLFANFPGGAKLGNAAGRQTQTVIRPMPGEWVNVDGAGGEDIRKVLLPMPYKPPSAEAIAVGEGLEKKVAEIAGIIDMPVGEGRIGNTPVGTMMAYVEAVSQVPGAVHKDDHAAQAEEFELLRELLAEEPECLTRGNRTPQRKWELGEELLSPDLVPAADPNTPSAVHRLMKLQALVQLGGLPQFNMPAPIADNRAIYEHAIQLLGTGAPNEFTIPPQPPQAQPQQPDPRIVAAQIKAESQQASDQTKLQAADLAHQERMAELQQEGAQRDADRQSDETRAAMSLEAARLKATHDTANAAADRAHEAGLAAMNATHEGGIAAADRQAQAGIAGAQLVQKHVQHLNELGAQQAQAAQEPEGS